MFDRSYDDLLKTLLSVTFRDNREQKGRTGKAPGGSGHGSPPAMEATTASGVGQNGTVEWVRTRGWWWCGSGGPVAARRGDAAAGHGACSAVLLFFLWKRGDRGKGREVKGWGQGTRRHGRSALGGMDDLHWPEERGARVPALALPSSCVAMEVWRRWLWRVGPAGKWVREKQVSRKKMAEVD